MNLRQRLDGLEAKAARIDPRLLEPDAGPVTEADVARELVAHVLWCWRTCCLPAGTTDVDNLCRGPARSEPDPDGRWSWPTWQPDRPPGEIPERADLFLQLTPHHVKPWKRRNVPMPEDLSTAPAEAWLCSVWSGTDLCPVWEFLAFEEIREQVEPYVFEQTEPAHRPLDAVYDRRGATYTPRSALARWREAHREAADPLT